MMRIISHDDDDRSEVSSTVCHERGALMFVSKCQMPFKDYYWIVTNVKYSIACCFFFTLQCTKIKVFKWFLTIWLYLTRQYSIFHLVFASINPHKEYCQMQSQKILNNRDYFPCKNTLLLMHKVMWLLITTIRSLKLMTFCCQLCLKNFFLPTCSCIGKSPPRTRSPGICTIFRLLSAFTRLDIGRMRK